MLVGAVPLAGVLDPIITGDLCVAVIHAHAPLAVVLVDTLLRSRHLVILGDRQSGTWVSWFDYVGRKTQYL